MCTQPVQLTVAATPATVSCTDVLVNVSWKNIAYNTVSANSLTKNASNGNWDGNGFSYQSIVNNGYMQTTVQETTTQRMIGLSASDVNGSYSSIQYAFFLQSNGVVGIYESGSNRGDYGGYATNDVLKIINDNNVIKYYKNGSLVYVSTVTPSATLYVDVSTNTSGATLSAVKVANGSSTAFTANATNVAVSPVYQWKLNGSPVGTNSTTYTNNGLVLNDVVTCELTVCGVTYVSNSTTVNVYPASKIYITGTHVTACTEAIEDVTWTNTAFNTVASNSLTKNASNGNWDGNAFSYQSVVNNGYMLTTAQETTTYRMIGLSATDGNSSYNTIQFAYYLQPSGVLGIYESGNSRGSFGTYATNDILKISNESNVIKYYKNNVLIYTSAVVPSATMYVDVSTNSSGATVSTVKVSNGSFGVFNAVATNMGSSPVYQWKVNGTNAGTNSSTYNYSGFLTNDVITCSITVCGNTVTSNNINIKITTTNWLGTTNAWNTSSNWDNGVPTACVSANILSGTNDPVITTAALVNSLKIGTGRSLTISASNTLDVYGNWNDLGSFITGTSTVNFVGTAPQLITKTGGETFNNINMNGSGIKTLGKPVNIAGTLTLTNGIVQSNTTSDTLTITSVNAISGGSNTSHVNGILSQKITTTAAKTYPVGDGTYYLPVTLTYPSVTTAGAVAVFVTNGDHPNINSNACLNPNQSVNKYWTINKVGTAALPAPQSYAATFGYPTLPNAGVADAGASSGYTVFTYDGANWSSLTTTSSTTTATAASPVTVYGAFELAIGTSTISGWSGMVDNNWFNASNWSCGGVPSSLKDASIPSGLINYPLINATASVKTFTILNGGTATVSGSNILNVYGDWVNNGTFVPNTSTVVLTGATPSAVSGTATTNFSVLKVDKTSASTVTVSGPVFLQDKLTFGTNAVNTLAVNNAGGGSFTFKSDAISTAHVDVLSTVTKPIFSGNFTCQKYLPAQNGRHNFMLGAPVSNAFVSAFQPTTFDGSGYPTNGFLITGPFTGTSTGTGLVTFANSSFAYNPSTGSYSGYPVSGGDIAASALTPGQGYRFSVRDDAFSQTTVVKTLAVTGALVPAGAFTFTGLVNGANTKPFSSSVLPGSSSVGGWNLISNPYMSDISIDLSSSTFWTKTNMSNSSYVYDAATRGYLTCASGVGTCTVPAFQGFFVQATGAPALAINEAAKVTTTNNTALHRVAQTTDALNYLGITLTSSVSAEVNKTYIRYINGAAYGYDSFDGFKLGATKRNALSGIGVYSEGIDGEFYDVNAKPHDFVVDTTELLVKVPAGAAQLDFSDITNLEAGYDIALYDKLTKTLTDVTANPVYDFAVSTDSNSSGPRFQVIFNNRVASVADHILDGVSVDLYPNPTVYSNVKLVIGNYSGKVDVKLYDLLGNLVYTTQAIVDQKLTLPLTLPHIAGGVYTLKVDGNNVTSVKKLIIR